MKLGAGKSVCFGLIVAGSLFAHSNVWAMKSGVGKLPQMIMRLNQLNLHTAVALVRQYPQQASSVFSKPLLQNHFKQSVSSAGQIPSQWLAKRYMSKEDRGTDLQNNLTKQFQSWEEESGDEWNPEYKKRLIHEEIWKEPSLRSSRESSVNVLTNNLVDVLKDENRHLVNKAKEDFLFLTGQKKIMTNDASALLCLMAYTGSKWTAKDLTQYDNTQIQQEVFDPFRRFYPTLGFQAFYDILQMKIADQLHHFYGYTLPISEDITPWDGVEIRKTYEAYATLSTMATIPEKATKRLLIKKDISTKALQELESIVFPITVENMTAMLEPCLKTLTEGPDCPDDSTGITDFFDINHAFDGVGIKELRKDLTQFCMSIDGTEEIKSITDLMLLAACADNDAKKNLYRLLVYVPFLRDCKDMQSTDRDLMTPELRAVVDDACNTEMLNGFAMFKQFHSMISMMTGADLRTPLFMVKSAALKAGVARENLRQGLLRLKQIRSRNRLNT